MHTESRPHHRTDTGPNTDVSIDTPTDQLTESNAFGGYYLLFASSYLLPKVHLGTYAKVGTSSVNQTVFFMKLSYLTDSGMPLPRVPI